MAETPSHQTPPPPPPPPAVAQLAPESSDPVQQQYWCYQCEKRVSVETLADLPEVVCFECKNGFVEAIAAPPRTSDLGVDDPNFSSQFIQVLRLIAQAARDDDAPPPPPSEHADPSDDDYLRIELDGWDHNNDDDDDDNDDDNDNEVVVRNESDDEEGEENDHDENEEDTRRRRREVLRLRLRDLAARAANRRNRILDWAEILMGLEDHSIELRLHGPEMDDYVGNPEDYLDAAGYEALLQNLADSDGNGRRGAPPASKSAVLGLKTLEIETGEDCVVCAVCKDLVNVGEKGKEMPCGHGYHEECIVPWLGSRNSCPVCRFEQALDMEDKRKDGGNQPRSAAADSAVTPSKLPDSSLAAEAPSSRRRGGSHKRKAASISSGNNGATPPTTSSKRQAREKSSAVAPIHNGPTTRARQSPAADEAVKIEVAAEVGGGPQVVRVSGETSGVVEVDWEAKFEAEYEVIRSRGVNVHAVPIPADWFSWSKVHPLEEQAMPSFFNGKSENRTPEIYMGIRNWIMRKFHVNPSTLVELKDLSDLSVGELDARKEVMEFLDHWGLINYHPFPESGSTMNHNVDGEAKTDSLVEKLYRFEAEQSCAPVAPRTNAMTAAAPSGLFPESSVAEELAKTEEGPSVEYHCNSCSADCSRKRYHNQKQADFDLCSECFNNGKFDSDMSPTDFILMEPAEAAGVSGGKWTDQETLLLLEALELYKENWNEIAEHVATKTKTQCILHFVQMPIEETFMDRDDHQIDASLKETADPDRGNTDSSAPNDPAETTESRNVADDNKPESSPMEILKPEDPSEVKVSQETNENCALKALKEAFEAVGSFPAPGEQFSFAEAGNPVMALAAFLVRMAEPNAAAALVRSSLKSISGNSSSIELAARHCFLLHDPPDNKKKSADSERSVAETVGQDALNNEKENEENKKEKSKLVVDGGNLPSDRNDDKDKGFSRKEELSTSPNGGLIEKSHPEDLATTGAKESDDLTPKPEIHPDNPDLPKDAATRSAKESEDLTSKEEIPSSSAKGPGDGALEDGPSNCTEVSKDIVAVPDSLPSEKEPVTSNSITENGRKQGEEETKDFTNETQDPLETKDDHNVDKVKRAAVTAISAAAVKAKLLADQEEDQIRQLATLLIDKQLHKLENKLAFFSDMESVVMRVREQMERSKQKLYQERAHIIASRMGFSAPSSRPMQQSIPINRVAMGFANSVVKPPMGMGMTSQRPPMARSMMMSAPSAPNTFVPATSAGNPVRPTNQDKISFGPK